MKKPQTKDKKRQIQVNATVVIAFLSFLTSCFAAYSAWRSSVAASGSTQLARMQYENTVSRIQFAFKAVGSPEPQDHSSKGLQVCQISGDAYSLDSIEVIPVFREEGNDSPVEGDLIEMSINNWNQNCGELSDLEDKYCTRKGCANREIVSLTVRYKVFDRVRERGLTWQ